MTYDANTIKEMIPLYLNGRLPEEEKDVFLQGLEEYPDLAAEMADFQEIDAVYQDLENSVPFPDQGALFKRILDNIDQEGGAESERKRKTVRPVVTPGLGDRLIDFLQNIIQIENIFYSKYAG